MPMLVVDASAALHVALADRPTAELEHFELVAPPLFLSERTSSLAAAAFRGAISQDAVMDAFDRLEAMTVRIVEADVGHRRAALALARALGWAKSYDAEYVVLAQRLSCSILTTDVRLARGAAHLVQMVDPRDWT